jgi:hypothetical protein
MNNKERELEQLSEAKKRWVASEFRLNILRTVSGNQIPDPTDEEILTWHQQTKSFRPFS